MAVVVVFGHDLRVRLRRDARAIGQRDANQPVLAIKPVLRRAGSAGLALQLPVGVPGVGRGARLGDLAGGVVGGGASAPIGAATGWANATSTIHLLGGPLISRQLPVFLQTRP